MPRLLRRRRASEAAPPPDTSPPDLSGATPRRRFWLRRLVRSVLSGLAWVGRQPDLVVVLLTLLALAVAWPTIGVTHDPAPSLWPVLGVMTVAPLLVIRRAPAVAWALAVAGCVVWWLFVPELAGAPMHWPVMQFLVLLVTLLACALWAEWHEIAGVVAVTAAFMALAMPQELKGWALGQALFVGVGLLVRWLVLSRLQLAQEKAQTETERAQRAVVEERARIARELHDVVAHHMSMIVVQSQSAPLRLGVSDPAVTKEFSEIEHAAREALGEVRGVLGVLRAKREEAEREPQPGLEQMPRVLAATKAAGMPLTWTLEVDPERVPPGTALVLYRVLQESLANAARHAAGSQVGVVLRPVGDRAVLTVQNGPGQHGTPPPERSGGAGIDGMTARAEAVGGTLRAEPDNAGGFIVQAEVPLTGRPTASGLG